MSTNLCSVAAVVSSFSVHLYTESTDFHWPQLCDARRMPLLGSLWLVVSSQQRETWTTDWSELKRREKVVQVHLETQQEENQIMQSFNGILSRKKMASVLSPLHARSTCTEALVWGRCYSQTPSCGERGRLPVMVYLLPVYTNTKKWPRYWQVINSCWSRTSTGSLSLLLPPWHHTGYYLIIHFIPALQVHLSPACPPASSGSAGGCRMALTSGAAGKGGALAAGCCWGRPWSWADGRGRGRPGGQAATGDQLRLLPLPVRTKTQ